MNAGSYRGWLFGLVTSFSSQLGWLTIYRGNNTLNGIVSFGNGLNIHMQPVAAKCEDR